MNRKQTQSQTKSSVTQTPLIERSILRRSCACGNHTVMGGECRSCSKNRGGMFQQTALSSSGSNDVQRLHRQKAESKMLAPKGTNYAFDTFNVTEAQLSDPDIIARFHSLSRAGLIEYRKKVSDPAVQKYITQLIAATPSVPCTTNEISRTNAQAEAARKASVPWASMAQLAMDRLHSRWIDNKADILAGNLTLSGEVVCAFDSNFNISQRDPNYGVQQIRVSQRLKQLASRLNRVASYACQPDDDPVCTGNERDTIAYVRGGQPPIHFCPQFRDDPDTLNQQSTVVHEYSHLLPGVHDEGGYALGGFGAQITTCQAGAKFRAASDVLANTADALTGFVMHIGQFNATNVTVSRGSAKPTSQSQNKGASQKVTAQPPPTKVAKSETAGEDDKPKVSVASSGEIEAGKETEASSKIALEMEIPLWKLQTKHLLFGSPLRFLNQFSIEPSIGFKAGDEQHRLFTPLALEGSLKMISIEWEKATRAGLFKFELSGAGKVGGEWVPQSNETSIKFGGEAGGELEYRPMKDYQFFVKIEAKGQGMWEKKGDLRLEWKGISFDAAFKLGYEF